MNWEKIISTIVKMEYALNEIPIALINRSTVIEYFSLSTLRSNCSLYVPFPTISPWLSSRSSLPRYRAPGRFEWNPLWNPRVGYCRAGRAISRGLSGLGLPFISPPCGSRFSTARWYRVPRSDFREYDRDCSR